MEFPNAENSLLIVISPHLDDAVFSLGGLLAKDPKRAKVVSVFCGTPAKPLRRIWDLASGFRNSTEAMKERVKENEDALRNIGVPAENIINLSFLDRQYRETFWKRALFSGESEQKLLAQIRSIVAQAPADARVSLFVPLLDRHEDHRIVRDAVTRMYRDPATDKKIVSLFLYQDMPYFYASYKKEKGFPSRAGSFFIGMSAQEFEQKMLTEKMYASQFKSRLFGFHSLERLQRFISETQAKLFAAQAPHCEVVYQIDPAEDHYRK